MILILVPSKIPFRLKLLGATDLVAWETKGILIAILGVFAHVLFSLARKLVTTLTKVPCTNQVVHIHLAPQNP